MKNLIIFEKYKNNDLILHQQQKSSIDEFIITVIPLAKVLLNVQRNAMKKALNMLAKGSLRLMLIGKKTFAMKIKTSSQI